MRYLILFLLTTLIVACSSDNNGNPSPMDNDTPSPLLGLSAEVSQWDSFITITYTLTNNSNQTLVSFDGVLEPFAEGSQSADYLNIDNSEPVMRLYKGKLLTTEPFIVSVAEQRVEGRQILPGATLNGVGSSANPIVSFDTNLNAETTTVIEGTIDFCIGYALLEDVADTVREGNMYPRTTGQEFQQLTCQQLTQPGTE